MSSPLLGAIGRNCVHDGPGIRTTLFFKGCSMRCPWCHNPELLLPTPELVFHRSRCIGCGDCAAVCPESAIAVEHFPSIEMKKCVGCGLCTSRCPARALEIVGRSYSVCELVEIVLRDVNFYEVSGGGVTLSGGEATGQLAALGPLLRQLKEHHLHTVLETNGLFDWNDFASTCLDHLDLVFFDVKIRDSALHKRVTGVSNVEILDNLKRLVADYPEKVVPRVPLVPGYTATKDNMSGIASLFRDCGVERCCLLPYHPFGRPKAEKSGFSKGLALPEKKMSRIEAEQWLPLFYGIEATIEALS